MNAVANSDLLDLASQTGFLTGKIDAETKFDSTDFRNTVPRFLAKRAEGNEANPKFLKRRYHRLFRFSKEQRVFALKCGDGLHRVSATNRLCARF